MAVAKTFTPELIANGRERYEQTDEPVASIAADFCVNERTLNKYRLKWGWTPRGERPAHGLSELARLREEAMDIPAPPTRAASTETRPAEGSAVVPADAVAPNGPADAAVAGADQFAERRAAIIDRMWRAVDAELGAVERMRAQLGAQSQRPVDAEKTARTLESIMRTLKEVDRLRFAVEAPAATDDDDYDDMPRDLEEFRCELARRIDAFVASRAGAGIPERSDEGEAADVEPARA
jgi:hypothetical protein